MTNYDDQLSGGVISDSEVEYTCIGLVGQGDN